MSVRTHYLDPFLQPLSTLGRENSSLNVFHAFSCVLLPCLLRPLPVHLDLHLPVSLDSGPCHPLCKFSFLDQATQIHFYFDASGGTDLL